MILSRRFEQQFPRLLTAIAGEGAVEPLGHGETLYQEFAKRYGAIRFAEYRLRCLSFLVPRKTISNGLINLYDQADLLRNQKELAPLANTDNDYGVIAIGDWSEGDAWVLDVNDGKVGSLGLGADVDTYAALKRGIYIEFSDSDQWLAFLAVEAFRREWIDAKLLRELLG